jgi:uncharacterized protein (DUF1684 family)
MAGLLATLLLAAAARRHRRRRQVAEDPAYAAARQQWRGALPGPDPARWLDGAGGPALAAEQIAFRWQRRHQRHPLTVGPDKLGLLRREGTQWWFTPEAGVGVSHDGLPVRGRIRVDTDKDAQPCWPSMAARASSASSAEERGTLRVKHADAPARRDFRRPAVLAGRRGLAGAGALHRAPAGQDLPIVDITGLTTEMPNAGAVGFERDGRSWRLEAIGAPGQPLFLIFADRTSGRGSYPAGRYLDTDAPAADGTVRIDFNHAYNPPCAFTAYATCPLNAGKPAGPAWKRAKRRTVA